MDKEAVRLSTNSPGVTPGRQLAWGPAILCAAIISSVALSICHASSDLILSDLWDAPHHLHDILRGETTILFVCDPSLATCREGAVYFDNQAHRFRARGMRPACVFTGEPTEARDAVLAMNIRTQVYVDPDGKIFQCLALQEIVPAMVLLDGSGQVIKALYGGGESLSPNLNVMLGCGPKPSRRWLLVILIPVVTAAIILLTVD